MDNDSRNFIILIIVAVVIGVAVWVIHFHIPSAPDFIKSIKFPSLKDIFKSFEP